MGKFDEGNTVKRELAAFLGQNGFQEIGTNFPDVSFFIRRENTFVLCLYVVVLLGIYPNR